MKFVNIILICFLCAACESQSRNIEVKPLNTATDISIRGAMAVSDSVVWLSGNESTVLRTSNGGLSWGKIIVSDSLNLDFRNLWAFDANTAIVVSVGSPAYIFKTTDSGATWKNVYYNDDKSIFMNSIAFKDARNGVTIGDQINGEFFTLKTQDGGDSWTQVKGAEGSSSEGSFAASNTCISYLPSGKIMLISGMTKAGCYTSNDSDFVWQKSTYCIPVNNPDGADGAYTIYMNNDMDGIIGGGNYFDVTDNVNVVCRTSDGGKSWSNTTMFPPHGFISCIKPFSSDHNAVLAIGSDGMSFSENFGVDWKVISSTDGYHTATSSPDGDVIYVAGAKGGVAKVCLKQISDK